MVRTRSYVGELVPPIQALEFYLQRGGTTILKAAFNYSFFVEPSRVRQRTPYFPDRVRFSRKFYPGKGRGDEATWEGRTVILGDNAYAQQAWQRYSGRSIYRGSGYSVRHIWGHPWNPDAFTAGWNLCYMPFWAGMLTERQHPHPELLQAVRQASWDLFFRNDPVCEPPEFVSDPGVELASLLGDQPLLLLRGETATGPSTSVPSPDSPTQDVWNGVKRIRTHTHQSWSNIRKAVLALQARSHSPFGSPNVEASSKSTVRRIQRETGLSLAQLEALLKKQSVWK